MATSGPQLPLPVQSELCFDTAQRGHAGVVPTWTMPRPCNCSARPAVSVRRAPRVKVLAAAWGHGAPAPAPPARTTSRASGRFAWHLGTWCGKLDIGALSTGAVGVEPIRLMGSPGWYEPGRRQVNDVLRPTAAGDHRRTSPQPGNRHGPLCRLDIGEYDRADPAATPRRR